MKILKSNKEKTKIKLEKSFLDGYKIIKIICYKKEFLIIIPKILFILIIIHILIKLNLSHYLINQINRKSNLIINKPLLPETNKEYLVKKYHISEFNSSHIRYNFQNIYAQRKIFKINYSCYPYIIINKSISYDKNAEAIYKSTGMLNVTKLDFYYHNFDINTLNMNHINIAMGFDKNYIKLSTIAIASVLNTSSNDTYIHFHILGINFNFKDMKRIITLKKINKNVDFVFYNAKQAYYDFGDRGKREGRGVGNYARLLAAEIVNNTDRLLTMDAGDVIVQKDISEVYYYDLGNNYFAWILEDVAGYDENKYWDIFFRHYFYPNSGICLINVRLFRKDELYKKAFFISKAYRKMLCPFQDIIISISNYKFKFFPLNYNSKQFFENDEQKINLINETKYIKRWIKHQKYSPYKYTLDEILKSALNPVINHLYQDKITKGENCNSLTRQFIEYAKLTGIFYKIKKKYYKPFNICKNILKN